LRLRGIVPANARRLGLAYFHHLNLICFGAPSRSPLRVTLTRRSIRT
jgi:hypothetical protein